MAYAAADVLGALFTIAALGVLGAGGYLLALCLLGRERARSDALELAVAWLLCATGLGTGIGLALGACGELRPGSGLAVALAACGALAMLASGALAPRPLKRYAGWAGLAEPATHLGRRLGARLRQHWVLALLAFHAIGSEAVRGLLRPPLSWDSLMYHLLLAATWLQRHDLAPVFAAYPLNYYGYSPANGAVWLWWWMAPSHSELYANLAFLPQWALLGLGAGAVARRLGARDGWPLAALLVAMTPAVVRFAATQYVDIFTAACLLAACCFGLSWLRPATSVATGDDRSRDRQATSVATGDDRSRDRPATSVATGDDRSRDRQARSVPIGDDRSRDRRPRWGDAALAATGLGLAAGAKVLGLLYAGALAAALLPLAIGGWRGWRSWRQRGVQAAAALVLAAALGGFFYLRNAVRGVDPLALECEGLPHRQASSGLPALPRPNSVAALPRQMLAEGRLARAFLGTVDEPRSPFVDLGLGPQALLVLLGVPALAALPRERWREAALVGSQVLAEIAIWITVPYAASGHVFANVRYLLPAVGLAFAGGVAAVESRRADARLLEGIAVALAAQDLLQLHTQMSDGVRLAVAAADLAAVAFALSPRLRGWLHGRPAASGPTASGPAASGPALPGAPRRGPRLRPAGRALAATLAVLALVAGAPWLARFRAADRTRAFMQEYTAHGINVGLYAPGWDWLERHGGSGTVAVVNSPDTFFIYPAMGLRLARRALYVNVNAANLDEAAGYPLCQPRVQPAAAAWIANLRQAGVRWLDLSRTPPYPFGMENDWARARPDAFVQRFADPTNLIYEVLPAPPPAPPAPRVNAAADRRRPGA
jgi:hypothetical protein